MQTRFTLSLLSLFVAFLAFLPSAQAQKDGVYFISDSASVPMNGANGTNCAIAPAVTNTLAAFSVSETDTVGLQVSLKANGASTSTVQLMGYKSVDSTRYETAPSLNTLITLNGTAYVDTFIPQSVAGAGTFKISLSNTNAATVTVTNIIAQRRYKSPAVKTTR